MANGPAPDITPSAWKVTGTQQTVALDGNGKAVNGYQVSYDLAGVGSFTLFIPARDYAEKNVKAAIAADAAKHVQVAKLSGQP